MDRIKRERTGPGKFEGGDTVTEYLYDTAGGDSSWWAEELGEVEGFGWFALVDLRKDPLIVEEDDGSETEVIAAIINEDNYGFFGAEEFESWKDAKTRWSDIEEAYAQVQDEGVDINIEEQRDEIFDWMTSEYQKSIDAGTAYDVAGLAGIAAQEFDSEYTLEYATGEVPEALVDIAKEVIATVAAGNPAGSIQVMDLRTGEYVADYSLPPREAVMAAYAQFERKDWNTWDYEKRYGSMVTEGAQTFSLGDYTAMK